MSSGRRRGRGGYAPTVKRNGQRENVDAGVCSTGSKSEMNGYPPTNQSVSIHRGHQGRRALTFTRV